MHKKYDALPEWRVNDARKEAEKLRSYGSYEIREGAAQEMSFLCDCFSELRADYEELKQKFSEMQSRAYKAEKERDAAIKHCTGYVRRVRTIPLMKLIDNISMKKYQEKEK